MTEKQMQVLKNAVIKKEVDGLYNKIWEMEGKGEIVQLDEFNTIEAIKREFKPCLN